MTLELQFQVSREDFINFHLSYYKKTPTYIGWICLVYLIAIFYFLIFLISTYGKYKLIGLFTLFFILGLTPFIISWIYKKNIPKLYSLKIFDNYFLRTTMTVNEDGITLKTSLCELFFKWDALANLHFANENIYITTYMREFIFIGSNNIKDDVRKNLLDMILKSTNLKIFRKMPDIIFG